jgi:peptidoglycan-associated lipoprotein
MQKTSLVCVLMAAAVMMAGCASHKPKTATQATNGSAVPELPQTSGAGDANAAATQGAEAGGAAGAAGAVTLADRTIYFDFDSSEIKPEYNALIGLHARNLVANPSIRVRLEGNTDERGSREYNIGLGERRAQEVKRALMLQGVGESQITTVSYGEEHPAVTGHTEAAWARNRRVDIVYLN